MTDTERIMAEMGDKLIHLRDKAGYTQIELSRESKVSQQAISKLESGFHKKFPPLDTAFSLAKFFKVSKEYLLFGTEPLAPEYQLLIKAWERADQETRTKVILMLFPEAKPLLASWEGVSYDVQLKALLMVMADSDLIK